MKVGQKPYRTIWVKPGDKRVIQVIDQRFLPHRFVIEDLANLEQTIRAIKDMHVRGAPLIGATAAYGVYLALLEAPRNSSFDSHFTASLNQLRAARPTAVNLAWAIGEQLRAIQTAKFIEEKIEAAFRRAGEIADQDVETCRRIGTHGLKLIEAIYARTRGTVHLMTHCNAGWLACVDWGTQTAPIYMAHDQKIPVHVWVSETRPRNQGANLTAWELGEHGVPHTVIADNAAGHLLQRGMVDLVIVGTDRTTSYGDVANKIGTYLKALAAKESSVPFYVAVPSSSIDWTIREGTEIPIEERSADEVKFIEGLADGKIQKVLITPEKSAAKNYAFDVTPAKFVTGLITERGIVAANHASMMKLFPEQEGRDEGVIKFNCRWTEKPPGQMPELRLLNQKRNELYGLGFIGEYEDGIGFGNISVRLRHNQFLISGTQTGGISKLTEAHYTKVTEYDFSKNSVSCEGPVKASSESLTHAMLYELSSDIHAVVHTHNKEMWDRLRDEIPTTRKHIPYGTPEMAEEVKRLFGASDLKKTRAFVMAGHEDGIVTFGQNLEEAVKRLLELQKQIPVKR